MIRYSITSVVVFAAVACTFLYTPADAGTVRHKITEQTFSPAEEAKIDSLEYLSTQEAFRRLEDPLIKRKRTLSYKAVDKAFGHRRAEAFRYAERYLKDPLIEVVKGRRITRVKDFNTAKKVFETFPEEAARRLPSIYQRSRGVMRGNIVRASGQIAGGAPIRSMLVEALDDRSVAEEASEEELGDPLRVCDIAYNQLVLRYEFRDVLRTISPAHKIGVRDYHISLLKQRLGDYFEE